MVQELLSIAENEDHRQLLELVSKNLEGARAAIVGKRVEHHDIAEEFSEEEAEEQSGGVQLSLPAHWIREGANEDKEVRSGGKGEKGKKRLGNVAARYHEATEMLHRKPTLEEEVEKAKVVVALLDDKYKGQQMSDGLKNKLLHEAMLEMATWIQGGGSRLRNTPSPGECLEFNATMERCRLLIGNAVAQLAAAREKEAQALAAAVSAGVDCGST